MRSRLLLQSAATPRIGVNELGLTNRPASAHHLLLRLEFDADESGMLASTASASFGALDPCIIYTIGYWAGGREGAYLLSSTSRQADHLATELLSGYSD